MILDLCCVFCVLCRVSCVLCCVFCVLFLCCVLCAVCCVLCGEVEDVVGFLTSVCRGVAQVFHDLLVELRLLLVAEWKKGKRKTDRRKAGK